MTPRIIVREFAVHAATIEKIVYIKETVKAFISGIFAGMAHDQANLNDFAGTKRRAELALRWASNSYTRAFAHEVNARAAWIGGNRQAAREHIDIAIQIIDTSVEIQTFPEVVALRSRLERIRGESSIT